MLDLIEEQIARKLSEHHFYPYAHNIYLDIFKAFSYFPIKMTDVGIKGEGQTITYLALVVLKCMDKKIADFFELYNTLLNELNQDAAKYYPQDITVETFFGCVLYHYHPVSIKNALYTIEKNKMFNQRQLYEYELKKKTVLIFVV